MLFRTIVHLFIFVGLVPVARLCEGSVFFQGAVTPMLETAKPGSLIAVETRFFVKLKTFGYGLSA